MLDAIRDRFVSTPDETTMAGLDERLRSRAVSELDRIAAEAAPPRQPNAAKAASPWHKRPGVLASIGGGLALAASVAVVAPLFVADDVGAPIAAPRSESQRATVNDEFARTTGELSPTPETFGADAVRGLAARSAESSEVAGGSRTDEAAKPLEFEELSLADAPGAAAWVSALPYDLNRDGVVNIVDALLASGRYDDAVPVRVVVAPGEATPVVAYQVDVADPSGALVLVRVEGAAPEHNGPADVPFAAPPFHHPHPFLFDGGAGGVDRVNGAPLVTIAAMSLRASPPPGPAEVATLYFVRDADGAAGAHGVAAVHELVAELEVTLVAALGAGGVRLESASATLQPLPLESDD